MKDEILAAAAKRAQGRGWWDCVPATQTKICDLLTCSQSTTNIFSSIFTARDNNSSLSLSFLSLLPTQFFPPYFCSSSFRMDNTIGLAELFCLFCF